MRKNILAVGTALLALALLLGISDPEGLFFSIPVSVLNIFLGLITKTPPGVEIRPESPDIRLIVDRGVVRASIYQVVFLNSKLILKRLSSVLTTVVLAFALAFIGLELLFIIGALLGGITGFSLQEFLTQRTRNKLATGTLLTETGRNDVEIRYDDLSEVRQIKSRVYFIGEKISLVASFPRGYTTKMKSTLESIFDEKFTDEESFRSAEAVEKENKKSHHTRRNCSKLSSS
ncbi:MAG TPA: hypothetical protein VFE96_01115 [Candidatus Bathyarchaeia archaeon]|jgi:hypothetical protein|nr:hypothetical protein [Candidatus Bathyarchaeia archaeon]